MADITTRTVTFATPANADPIAAMDKLYGAISRWADGWLAEGSPITLAMPGVTLQGIPATMENALYDDRIVITKADIIGS
jgi:hypothetical protein